MSITGSIIEDATYCSDQPRWPISSMTSLSATSCESPFTGAEFDFLGTNKVNEELERRSEIITSQAEDHDEGLLPDTVLLEYISTALNYDYKSRNLKHLLHDGNIGRRVLERLSGSTTAAAATASSSAASMNAGAELSRSDNFLRIMELTTMLELKLPVTTSSAQSDDLDESINLLRGILSQAQKAGLMYEQTKRGRDESATRGLALTRTSSGAQKSTLDGLFSALDVVNHLPAEFGPSTEDRSKEFPTSRSYRMYHQVHRSVENGITKPSRMASTSSRHSRPGLARSSSLLKGRSQSPLVSQWESEDSSTPVQRESVVVNNVMYLFGDTLGRGQFGTVYRAIDTSTGRIVAIKRIPIKDKPGNEVDQMMREVRLLRSLESPFVAKYDGYFKDDDYVSIVVEYVENGSLSNTLKTFGCFNERLSAGYVAEILQGLIYLHSQDVVHCDVKSANVLTTKQGRVKLIDFGISLHLSGQSTIKGAGVNGTPNWLAPEVISLRGTSKAADIWAVGCTILEMITGKPPYHRQNAMSTMYSIVEDKHPPLPSSISDALRAFLLQCFQKEPRSRPSAQMLLHDPWIRQHWSPQLKLDDIQIDHKTTQSQASASKIVSSPVRDKRFSLSQEIIQAGSMPTSPGEHARFELDGRIRDVPESLETLAAREFLDTGTALPGSNHFAVKTYFRHQVQCAICGESVRRAVYCHYCRKVSHGRCMANSIALCSGPLVQEDVVEQQNQKKGKRISRHILGACTMKVMDTEDHEAHDMGLKVALLPTSAVPQNKRHSAAAPRNDCRIM